MTADLRQIVEGVLLVFAALFPIVNPLGGAPIFLAMTSDYTPAERALLAWRVTVNAFVLLVASVATGTYVLEFFGLSVPVVQVRPLIRSVHDSGAAGPPRRGTPRRMPARSRDPACSETFLE